VIQATAVTGSEVAVVVGVGPGLGEALVLRFAAAGMRVAAISRRGLVPEWNGDRDRIRGYAADATVAGQVKATFARIAAELGPPDLVVFNVGTWDRGAILDISDELFEQAWRTGCFAGFLVGKAAAAAMLPRGRGTIIFTGATGSIRGSAGFAAFAVPKFGLRALAQSMARELGPKGVHVAHVIVDGMIDNSGDAESTKTLIPTAIAEAYHALHRQPRSAWTHEIDLRPADENF
jgi:NAD(P)-dependent dehydrogenase (short-subunit alcohol dehydrogenase family)